MLLLARYDHSAAIILNVTDFTGTIYIFYLHSFIQHLEATRGRMNFIKILRKDYGLLL